MASREQVIDDAIQLIKRFPEPPLYDPQDLEDLEADVSLLQSEVGSSLRLEDEVRSRVVMKLALYHIPSKTKMMRMPDRKCPCCLAETPSFIALFFCHAEFWSAGKYARIVPEGEAPKNRWDRERISRVAKEAYRKAQEKGGYHIRRRSIHHKRTRTILINPGKGEKGRGKGHWQQWTGDDYWTRQQQPRGRGGKGWQRRYQGGWEYRGHG